MEPGSEQLMAVFASDRSLQLLSTARVLAVDGTFFTCPLPFTQLYVLQVRDFYLPVLVVMIFD